MCNRHGSPALPDAAPLTPPCTEFPPDFKHPFRLKVSSSACTCPCSFGSSSLCASKASNLGPGSNPSRSCKLSVCFSESSFRSFRRASCPAYRSFCVLLKARWSWLTCSWIWKEISNCALASFSPLTCLRHSGLNLNWIQQGL